jgi:hypothetical protein
MDGERPRIYIHAGIPKTATTMLQQHLFAQHPQVRFLGKFENSPIRGFRDETVRRVMISLLRQDSDLDDVDSELDHDDIVALQKMADEAVHDNKSLVVSNENFASGSIERARRRAKRFKEIFTQGRVLLVVREPMEYIESHYFQHLRGYNLKQSGYQNLKHKLNSEPPLYFDINRWLDVIWDKFKVDYLDYAAKANQYAEVFGRERVKVMSFDLLRSDFRGFISELSEWFDIDPENSLELCSGQRSNDRWTEYQIETLKRLESSFWLRRKYRRCQKASQRVAMLRGGPGPVADDSPKARAELTPHWRGIVEQFVNEKLMTLADEWGITFHRRSSDSGNSTIPLPAMNSAKSERKIA